MISDTTIARQQYTLSTGTDALSFDFYVLDQSHIVVWNAPADGSAPSKLTLTTDYTVSGTGDEEGNVTVTMVGQSSGDKITVLRVPPLDQLLDLVFKGKVYAESLEDGLDKLTMICGALQEQIDRCLQYPAIDLDSLVNEIEKAADRANKVIRFDDDGNATVVTELGVWRGEWVTDTDYRRYDFFKVTDGNGIATVYLVEGNHTSTNIAADLAANDISVLIDGTAISAALTAAQAGAEAAETAQAAAEAAQAGAEAAETNAAASESAADSSASASASSASASATSATTAASEASNAAASAAAAALDAATLDSVANNLEYKGNYDASGNTAPSGATVGQFWTISVAGTFGSIAWALGDLALYDGTNWHKQDLVREAAEGINPKWYGATGDGTTDDSTAMQNALDAAVAAGKPLMIPAGEYLLSSNVSNTSADPVEIIGYGMPTIVAPNTFALNGPATSTLTLSVNANRGDTTITVTDASGVVDGQAIWLYSSEIVETERNRPHNYIARVTGVSGNVITLSEPLTLNFHTTDTGLSVSHFDLRDVKVSGLKVRANNNRPFDISKARITLRDIEAFAGTISNSTVLFAQKCIGCWVENVYFHDTQYGIQMNTCNDVRFKSIRSDRTRHPIVPAFFSMNFYVDGLSGEDNTAIMDSHDAFNINYENVHTRSDTDVSNIRSCGGSAINCNVRCKGSDAAPFNQVLFTNGTHDYSDLFDEVDFMMAGCRFEMDGGIHVNYGRNVIIRDSQFLKRDGTPSTISTGLVFGNAVLNTVVENCVYDLDASRYRGGLGEEVYTAGINFPIADTTYDGGLAGNQSTIATGGSGYSDANDVALTGGTGSGATVDITTTDGAVTGVTFNQFGSGYTLGDTLTVSGGNSDATFTVVLANYIQKTYKMRPPMGSKYGRYQKWTALLSSELNTGGDAVFAMRLNHSSNSGDNAGTSGWNFIELSFLVTIRHNNAGISEMKRIVFHGQFLSGANRFWSTPALVSDDTGQSNTTLDIQLVDWDSVNASNAGHNRWAVGIFRLTSGRTAPRYGLACDIAMIHMPN